MTCACADEAIEFPVTQRTELPPRTLTWIDPATGAPYLFGTNAHTFALHVETPTVVVSKTVGIAGSDSEPNVQISFTEDEPLLLLAPGRYPAQLWATRTVDGLELEPIRLCYIVRRAIVGAVSITGIDGGDSSPGPVDIYDGGAGPGVPVDVIDGGS